MNKNLCLFAILILLCAMVAGAKNPLDITFNSTEETTGRGLEIHTNPANVEVYIDGIYRGLTPFTINTLIPGDYSLLLKKDGFYDYEQDITIFRASRLVVSVKMEKSE